MIRVRDDRGVPRYRGVTGSLSYPSGSSYFVGAGSHKIDFEESRSIHVIDCDRCGSEMVINLEKLDAVSSINCTSCGAPLGRHILNLR